MCLINIAYIKSSRASREQGDCSRSCEAAQTTSLPAQPLACSETTSLQANDAIPYQSNEIITSQLWDWVSHDWLLQDRKHLAQCTAAPMTPLEMAGPLRLKYAHRTRPLVYRLSVYACSLVVNISATWRAFLFAFFLKKGIMHESVRGPLKVSHQRESGKQKTNEILHQFLQSLLRQESSTLRRSMSTRRLLMCWWIVLCLNFQFPGEAADTGGRRGVIAGNTLALLKQVGYS